MVLDFIFVPNRILNTNKTKQIMGTLAKASKKFINGNVEKQILDGETIVTGITANQEKLPKLPDMIANYTDKNTALKAAAVAAKNGDNVAKEALKRTRKEWQDMYGDLTDFVSFNAGGNTELILACGFVPTKTVRNKKQNPDMLQDVKAAPGKGKGTAAVACKAQKGNNGYAAVAATPDTKVVLNGNTIEIEINGVKAYVKLSGKASVEFENLQSAQPLCISMVTFNSAGTSPLAPSIEVTPQ